MGRDSKAGRGKTNGRGSGRRMFIENDDELEIRNREVKEASAARRSRREEEGSADEDEDEEQVVEGAEVRVCIVLVLWSNRFFRRLMSLFSLSIRSARRFPTSKERKHLNMPIPIVKRKSVVTEPLILRLE